MFGLRKKKKEFQDVDGVVRRTQCADMETLSRIIYTRVVSGCNFAIGVVVLEKSLFSKRLNFLLNQEFSLPMVVDYVIRRLKPTHLEKMFRGEPGLIFEKQYCLHRVKSADYGLPINTLVALIAGPSQRHRMLVFFGGDRVEERADIIVEEGAGESPESSSEETPEAPFEDRLKERSDAMNDALQGNFEEVPDEIADRLEKQEIRSLLERLMAIHPKRLFDYETDSLATLMNELEDYKEAIPIPLRPRYTKINQYLFKQRFSR